MIAKHLCSYACGLGSATKSAKDMAMEKERQLRIRIGAPPAQSRNSWTPGKRAFVDAWAQVDDFPPTLKANAVRASQLAKNFDVVYIHETSTSRRLGVFAGYHLKKNRKIISERPSFSCVQWGKGKRTAKQEWLKLSHRQREDLRVWFRKLRKVPHGGNDTFTDSDQKRLENFVSNYGFWDPQRDRAHIYRLTSHINHACKRCANAEIWVDSARPNKIDVKIVRDVEKDEEIFICYNRKLPFGCALCPEGQNLCERFRAFVKRLRDRKRTVNTEKDDQSDDSTQTASRKSSLPVSSCSDQTLVNQ